MATNADGDVQQHPVARGSPPLANDDEIGLDSTDEEVLPSDTEYVVEAVRSERPGQQIVLVEWANFPIDQCTWEPIDNLPQDLRDSWAQEKVEQDPSIAAAFEQRYYAALKAKEDESRQRHRGRNAKRKRLGLPITPFRFNKTYVCEPEDEVGSEWDDPNNEGEARIPDINDSNSSEVEKASTINHRAVDALKPPRKSSSREKPKKDTRLSNGAITFDLDKTVPKKEQAAKTTGKQGLPEASQPSVPHSTSRDAPQSQAGKQPLRDRETFSVTGYQGSARKSAGSNAAPRRPVNTAAGGSTAGSAAIRNAATGQVSASCKLSANGKVPPTGKVESMERAAASSAAANKTVTTKKRIQPQTKAPVNIFDTGKISTGRTGIAEMEVDASRPAKLYNSHSYLRNAQKRSRDKEDLPPDIDKLPSSILFEPGSNITSRAAPPRHISKAGDDVPSDTAEGPASGPSTIAPNAPMRTGNTASLPPKATLKRPSESLEPDDRQKKTRANPSQTKSVHFTEADGEHLARGARKERFPGADEGRTLQRFTGDYSPLVSEPMEIDDVERTADSTFVDTSNALSGAIPAPTKKLSLATYYSGHARSLVKQIELSTSPKQPLGVIFNDIPKANSQSADQRWLTDFVGTDCLHFGHTALGETFTSQLCRQFQFLCSGTVTSTDNSTTLEVIADHLRATSSGLFATNSEYNLLLFPTRCEENFRLREFGVDPTSSEGVPLKYLIFKSEHPISQLIRPFSDTLGGIDVEAGKEKTLLFGKLLDIRWSDLTKGSTTSQQGNRKTHFFLAFPKRSSDWFNSICSWLYVRDPSCRIYSNNDPGAWDAFREHARKAFGVVFIHDTIFPFIRRFPTIARLLQYNDNFSFWTFSEALDMNPLPPKDQMWKPVIPSMFSRLFPYGKAILLTPSFMVSEPQATLKLIKYFFETRHSANKLVTAYNITEYLRDLAGEKCAQQWSLKETHWRTMNPMDVANSKVDLALTDDDLESRQKAWLYMNQWLIGQPELHNLVFADRSIDPHDEQSLVNWFGWWSLAHSDRCRKFYVLGSSSSMNPATNVPSDCTRASRKVLLPRYDRSVINDPDEAMRTKLVKAGITAGAEQRPENGSRNSSLWFESEYLQNNDNNISKYLSSHFRLGGPLKNFGIAVSWIDMSMADHFGDHHAKFATFQQWWNYASPWLKDPTGQFRTYTGFFYTIAENGQTTNFPRGLRPKRHPWLAIYRPVNPHEMKSVTYQQGPTELIIWDVRAENDFGGKAFIDISQLTWMQQELIRFIQVHAHEKNSGNFLQRVWLGGFQQQQADCQSTLAVDMTIDYLTRLNSDLKWTLPGFERYLKKNGYREVPLSPLAPTLHSCNQHQSTFQDVDEEDGHDPDSRIIFHPPRGSEQLKPKGLSKCTNDLYEAARLARLRDKNKVDMTYTYRPTMEWYQQQVAEGRQYEHIMVDSWDKVFHQLRIRTRTSADQVPVSATSERGQAPWSRKSSMGSAQSTPAS